MHHQSLGLNTLSSSRSTRLRLRRGKVTSWRRRRSSWSRGAWVRRCYRFIFRDPCSVCGACVLPILTGWFGGPKTEALAHCDEHELIEAGFGSLADIFDLDQKQLKRSLVAARAINWANDPSARGAYSYATPCARRNRCSQARTAAGFCFPAKHSIAGEIWERSRRHWLAGWRRRELYWPLTGSQRYRVPVNAAKRLKFRARVEHAEHVRRCSAPIGHAIGRGICATFESTRRDLDAMNPSKRMAERRSCHLISKALPG